MAQEQNTQPIGEHLVALRKILLHSVAAIGIAFLVVFYAAIDPLMEFITAPIEARGIEFMTNKLTSPLVTKMKVALIAAIVLASPYVIWQVWSFIRPALYEHEKRAFVAVFAAMVVLFTLGIVFCYGVVYFMAVDFLAAAGEDIAKPMITLADYVDYLFGFMLPFGLAFELPVALYITTKMGMTNYEMLASKRKFVILAVVVVAAFLTPPDVVSQIMLSIPMLLLFELSLLICKAVKPKDAQQEA